MKFPTGIELKSVHRYTPFNLGGRECLGSGSRSCWFPTLAFHKPFTLFIYFSTLSFSPARARKSKPISQDLGRGKGAGRGRGTGRGKGAGGVQGSGRGKGAGGVQGSGRGKDAGRGRGRHFVVDAGTAKKVSTPGTYSLQVVCVL